MKDAVSILDHYAPGMLDKFCATNGMSSYNPYHNLTHALRVVKCAHDACLFEYANHGTIDTKSVVIAALFHDWRHCGKPGGDSLNTAIASRAPFVAEDKANVSWLIKMTKYPAGFELDALAIEAKILRDADVWSSIIMDADDFYQLQQGLAMEMGVEFKTWCDGNVGFLLNYPTLTEWALGVVDDHLEGKVEFLTKWSK
mgnify:CR=1 FL=1